MMMKHFLGAAALALSMGLPAAQAAPAMSPASPNGIGIFQVQEDCHSDVRRHYLREEGRRVEHRHRRNCRVVLVEPEPEEEARDCHSDVQRHRIPEYRRPVEHRHRRNCDIVIVEPDEEEEVRDCHRDPQRHYLPEYGRSTWHRHAGPRCRVEELRESDRRGEGCVKVGPVTVCP